MSNEPIYKLEGDALIVEKQKTEIDSYSMEDLLKMKTDYENNVKNWQAKLDQCNILIEKLKLLMGA